MIGMVAAATVTIGVVIGSHLNQKTCAIRHHNNDQNAVSAEPGSTITLCDDQPLLNQYGEDLNTTVHVYGGGCKTGLLENPGGSFTVAAEDGKLSCTRTDSLPGFAMVGSSMMDLSGISCVRNSHGNTQTGIKPPKNPLD